MSEILIASIRQVGKAGCSLLDQLVNRILTTGEIDGVPVQSPSRNGDIDGVPILKRKACIASRRSMDTLSPATILHTTLDIQRSERVP